MTSLQNDLFALQDKKYQQFQSKLLPTINSNTIIGIRVPILRDFAKSFSKTGAAEQFLGSVPHDFYEENLLHMILLSFEKDFDVWKNRITNFLPQIDNWAVCDMCVPKILKTHHQDLLPLINSWIHSDKTYTIRYGIGIFMREFLDEDFSPLYLDEISKIRSNEYYVNMMIAWYFATALSKQWDSTIKYLETDTMEKWTHNKTIQKAIESYRITPEQKSYLRTLKKTC